MYEKRKPEEIKLHRNALKQYLFGSAIGLSVILVLIINMIFGWVTFESVNANVNIYDGIYFNFFFAALQDIVYYLIIFRISEQYLGSYIAAIISGIIFGFKHLLFPDYSFFCGLMIFFDAFILFPSLYIRSRNIWTVLGFHFTWNFIQTTILGISKIPDQNSVFNLNVDGPILFAGDTTGFEPSIFTFIIAISIGLYLFFEIKKQNKIIKPFWAK